MDPKIREYMKRMGSKGGKKRSVALTPERRQEIARMGGNARAAQPRPQVNEGVTVSCSGRSLGYHVFTVGGDRCSMCGEPRWPSSHVPTEPRNGGKA